MPSHQNNPLVTGQDAGCGAVWGVLKDHSNGFLLWTSNAVVNLGQRLPAGFPPLLGENVTQMCHWPQTHPADTAGQTHKDCPCRKTLTRYSVFQLGFKFVQTCFWWFFSAGNVERKTACSPKREKKRLPISVETLPETSKRTGFCSDLRYKYSEQKFWGHPSCTCFCFFQALSTRKNSIRD